MNISRGILKSAKMAKVPAKPLLAIVGSTGTGKSDVCLINLGLFKNQDMDPGY
jgi:predicted GTPase